MHGAFKFHSGEPTAASRLRTNLDQQSHLQSSKTVGAELGVVYVEANWEFYAAFHMGGILATWYPRDTCPVTRFAASLPHPSRNTTRLLR